MQFLVDHIHDNASTRTRIDCIKSIRSYSGLGLKDAKDIADEFMLNQAKVITIPVDGGHGNSTLLVQELLNHGVAVTIHDTLNESLYATFKIAMNHKKLKVARSILDILIDIEGQ